MHLKSQILCTDHQKSIYNHWKQNRFSEANHLPLQYKISRELDAALFMKICNAIFTTQYALGLKFKECSNNNVVCVYDAGSLPAVQLHTISGNEQTAIQKELDLYTAKFFLRPFDLNKGKTFHIDIISIEKENIHYLLINCHHVICDTYCIQELLKLASERYNKNQVSGDGNVLHNACKYVALNEYTRRADKNAGEQIKQEIAKARRSGIFLLRSNDSRKSSFEHLVFNQNLKVQIEKACLDKDVPPYVFYLGCYHILLHKSLGRENLCTGIQVANRPEKGYRDVVGYFVNTLPITSSLHHLTLINDLFRDLKQSTSNLLQNRNADLRLLPEDEENQAEKHSGYYDNTFTYFKNRANFRLSGCEVSALPVKKRHNNSHFSVIVEDATDDLKIKFIYDSSISFDADIRSIFLDVVDEVLKPANKTIADIQLNLNNNYTISGEQTVAGFSADAHIDEKLHRIAFNIPDRVA